MLNGKGMSTYNESCLVKAVDDVEHWRLPSLVEVRCLEEGRLGHAKVFRSVVEVLNVGHRDEAAGCFRLECNRRLAGKRVQFIKSVCNKNYTIV